MSESDAPARRHDGTLKDASEMEWEYSPTSKTRPLPPVENVEDTDMEDIPPMGVKEKKREYVSQVQVLMEARRIPKPSNKATVSATQNISPKTKKFLASLSRSDGGKKTSAAFSSSSGKGKIKSTNPSRKPTATTSKQPAKRKRPPSPEQLPRKAQKSNASSRRTIRQDSDSELEDKNTSGVEGDASGREEASERLSEGANKKKHQPHDDDNNNNNSDIYKDDNAPEVERDDLEGDEGLDGNNSDEYAQLKADRLSEGANKKPRRNHQLRGHDNRTQDIRAMFTKAVQKKKVDGEEVKGHICNTCSSLGIQQSDRFFTGGNSSLRKHIRRHWSTHGQIYIKKCEELNMSPVPAALPPQQSDVEPTNGTTTQSNLNDFAKSVPKWSKEGLLEHIMDLIVTDNQSFRIVDNEKFRTLLRYQRPAMNESDIPHRTKLHDEIIFKANEVIERLKKLFATIPGRISFTFDAWTSHSYDPYLAVTAHYIDSPLNQPFDWQLQSKIIGFEELQGRHSGENMAATISKVLDTYEIKNKLGWATADNATSNDKALRSLDRTIKNSDSLTKWVARDRRVRCMEHTIYLAAGDFIKALGPKIKTRTQNQIESVEDADEDDEEDWVADWNHLDSLSENDAVDEEIKFEAGDTLGKALALVNQIRASPQAKVFFSKCCVEENIPVLELIKWVRTRWGSMHDLIDRVLECKKAILKFCALADHSLPKLKKKKYSDYRLEPKEWTLLDLIREVLQEPRNAQSTFSSEKEPTLWKAIPILECIQSRWKLMVKEDKFMPVHAALLKGLEKLKKWYINIKDSETYFICLGLHPALKFKYCEQNWDKEAYNNAKQSFEKMFDSYYKAPKKLKNSSQASSSDSTASFQGYGSAFILSTLGKSASSSNIPNDPSPRKELEDYLDSPGDLNAGDPIKWWGYHSQQYPTLSRMARDYLAIQGSSVASERAFSSAGITDDLRRNRIETETFGKLQILRYAYSTNYLNGSVEADAHKALQIINID